MSIFSKLKTRKSSVNENDSVYEQIFTNISDSDENALKEINDCLSDIRLYSHKNEDSFDERHLDISREPEYKLKWFGCIDILIKYGYAAEFDGNVDFDDFYDTFGKLKIVEKRGILPADDDIYLDYDLANWISCIDNCWSKSGMCVGRFDTKSDSYVIFPCTFEQLEKLSKLAEKAGRKIARSREI